MYKFVYPSADRCTNLYNRFEVHVQILFVYLDVQITEYISSLWHNDHTMHSCLSFSKRIVLCPELHSSPLLSRSESDSELVLSSCSGQVGGSDGTSSIFDTSFSRKSVHSSHERCDIHGFHFGKSILS